MSTLHSSTHPQLPSQLGDDEIDISQVAASLYRQKIWIGGITIAAALMTLSMLSPESPYGKAASKLCSMTKIRALVDA